MLPCFFLRCKPVNIVENPPVHQEKECQDSPEAVLEDDLDLLDKLKLENGERKNCFRKNPLIRGSSQTHVLSPICQKVTRTKSDSLGNSCGVTRVNICKETVEKITIGRENYKKVQKQLLRGNSQPQLRTKEDAHGKEQLGYRAWKN